MSETSLAEHDLAALVDDWIDWAEAARRLEVSVGKVRTMIRTHELAAAAASAHDRSARRRWQLARTVAVLVAVLPVLVYGAGLDRLEPLAFVLADLLILAVIVMLLVDARRPWAGGTPRDFGRSPADAAGGS